MGQEGRREGPGGGGRAGSTRGGRRGPGPGSAEVNVGAARSQLRSTSERTGCTWEVGPARRR